MTTPASAESENPVRGEPVHFAYIDALRGWAFLMVMMLHVGQQMEKLPSSVQAYLPSSGIITIVSSGGAGVQLFFIISALTLTYSMNARARQESYLLWNYAMRRFFRIAPLFYAAVIFYLLISPKEMASWTDGGIQWYHILTTVLFINGWSPTTLNAVVPGGWSIAVEMVFYAIFPFLLKRITSLARAVAGVMLAILFAFIANGLARIIYRPPNQDLEVLYSFFIVSWLPAQLPVFLLGFVLFYILKDDQYSLANLLPVQRKRFSLLLLGICGYLFVIVASSSGLKYLPVPIAFSVVFVLLAWAMAVYPWYPLVNPAVRYLGKISFSCYLTHFAIVWYVAPYVFTFWPMAQFISNLLFKFVIFYGISLAGTILVSTLTYHLIEIPGMALGKALIRRHEATKIQP